MIIEPHISGAYGLLAGGVVSEPETHKILNFIDSNINENYYFIDVGASVGEFVLLMASKEKIVKVIAFEPNVKECGNIMKSANLNSFSKIIVNSKAVYDKEGVIEFNFSDKSLVGSSIFKDDINKKSHTEQVDVTTLDEELKNLTGNMIILMDIEGAEFGAIKGGLNIINNIKPLIIFEYNHKSQKYFSLKEIRSVLNDDYEIYRLRTDGRLDLDFSKTQNLLAVNRKSLFYTHLHKLFIK
ncbi:MAG: FkbM family methyltransferase [Ignavibacteria bacterium]|jgi:FkbM family methyltransferase